LSQKRNFFADFFNENIFKIITSIPVLRPLSFLGPGLSKGPNRFVKHFQDSVLVEGRLGPEAGQGAARQRTRLHRDGEDGYEWTGSAASGGCSVAMPTSKNVEKF
jgi:hypothetical protein